MQQISIDFEVFKALTAQRVSEEHSYNDVLRDLLGLDSIIEPEAASDFQESIEQSSNILAKISNPDKGFSSRGIFLPNGTMLRATYKQQQYGAEIKNGRWINGNGKVHTSPSSAASDVTETNVNGLRFWQAKRPTDTEWCRLDLLK